MNKVIVSVEPQGSGWVVMDSRGRRHVVSSPTELGEKLCALMADPSLPTVQVEEPDHFVGFLASAARRFLPKHRSLIDACEPVAQQATALGRRVKAGSP